MNVAIVGSRENIILERVFEFVYKLSEKYPDCTVISGGANGVDKHAIKSAEQCGLETQVYPADWSQGKGAGIERNKVIANAADVVVAFWDGQSRGTRHMIDYATKLGKEVHVYDGFGILQEFVHDPR